MKEYCTSLQTYNQNTIVNDCNYFDDEKTAREHLKTLKLKLFKKDGIKKHLFLTVLDTEKQTKKYLFSK